MDNKMKTTKNNKKEDKNFRKKILSMAMKKVQI